MTHGPYADSAGYVGVDEAATLLGVTRNKVTWLIERGLVTSTTRSGVRLIDRASLERWRTPTDWATARPFARRSAWGLAALGDGEAPAWLPAATIRSLCTRLDDADASPGGWQIRLRARATAAARGRIAPDALLRMRGDRQVTVSGMDALETPSSAVDGAVYLWTVNRSSLDRLAADPDFVLNDVDANLVIRSADVVGMAAPGRLDGRTYRLIAAVDLLSDASNEAQDVGARLLEEVLADGLWRPLSTWSRHRGHARRRDAAPTPD